MAIGDKTSHWLQAGALGVALVGLYFSMRKKNVGQIQAQQAPTAPTPGVIQFTDPSQAQLPGTNIILGGDPIYTTYNYPPAPSNAAPGETASQGAPGVQYAYSRRGQGKAQGGCGCSSPPCPNKQFGSVESLGQNYIESLGHDLGNVFSVPNKGVM